MIGSGAVVVAGVLAAVVSLGPRDTAPQRRAPLGEEGGGRPGMPALIRQNRTPGPDTAPSPGAPAAVPSPTATLTARPPTAPPTASATASTTAPAAPAATAAPSRRPGKSGSAPGIRRKQPR